MIEAALAQAAVGFLVTKVAEGAAQALGSDAYKTALEKLKGFFNYKFAGKQELIQAESNPNALVALITQEASQDSSFKNELEKLVKTLQETSNAQRNDVSYNNVDSIADIDIDSVSGSNVGGRDVIAGNSVSGGQNNIGGDYRGSTFR